MTRRNHLVADVERSAAEMVNNWAASDAKLVAGYICKSTRKDLQPSVRPDHLVDHLQESTDYLGTDTRYLLYTFDQ
jgi:hypothetical protein